MDVLEVIERVGFPAFVAVFVLVRINGKLDKLTESIWELIRSLNNHSKNKED